jgi:hypothetical protein
MKKHVVIVGAVSPDPPSRTQQRDTSDPHPPNSALRAPRRARELLPDAAVDEAQEVALVRWTQCRSRTLSLRTTDRCSYEYAGVVYELVAGGLSCPASRGRGQFVLSIRVHELSRSHQGRTP